MTEAWNNYKGHDIYRARDFEEGKFGIYQIRMVDKDNSPIPVPRIGGTDPDGIIYIGRSGYETHKTDRSLAQRISEFGSGPSSGGETYWLMKEHCTNFRHAPYKDHRLQYRARHVKGTKREVDKAEIEALAVYFAQYGELPPCNSSFPGKWDDFYKSLKNSSKSLKC